jgi:hypothetical protein
VKLVQASKHLEDGFATKQGGCALHQDLHIRSTILTAETLGDSHIKGFSHEFRIQHWTMLL